MATAFCGVEYDNIFIYGKYIHARKAEKTDIYNFDNNMNKIELDGIIALRSTQNSDYSIAITDEEKYAILKNNELKEFLYDYLEYIDDNKFIAGKNEKYGIIDDNNNVVIDFKYDYLQNIISEKIIQGTYKVKEDVACEYMDYNGNKVEYRSTNIQYPDEVKDYIKEDLGYGQPYYIRKEE